MWRHVCLRNPFSPLIPSIHSPWEPQHAPPTPHFCIIPKFAVAEENLSHAGKQRVWSQSCGLPKVLQCTDCPPLWLLQTKFLASAGWKRGCEHFSYRCSDHMWRHVCFRIHSSHSVLEFQASTPYQKLEAPESRSMLHQFCVMLVSCPSLRCSGRKKRVSCKEAKGLVTELWSPRFVTHNTVIVSKVWVTGYWLCSQLWHVTAANQWNPMNNCRDWQDWDFSIRGLEVGLRAFQLRMFSKCDALPKRDLFDMFV